jgi:hypothetical protein
MSLDDAKKYEDKVFTNLSSSDMANGSDPLDDYAPRFGGVLPSDYNYMLAQQEINVTLAAIKKSAEDVEVQNFKMNSMRSHQNKAPTVTLVGGKSHSKAVVTAAPAVRVITSKKRKTEANDSSEPGNRGAVTAESSDKKTKNEKACEPVATKNSQLTLTEKKPVVTAARSQVKPLVQALASYESSSDEEA